MLGALADLLLPSECAGCRLPDHRLTYGVCPECISNVESLRPMAVRPTPAPAGLPPCFALGEYADELRNLLLAYKEMGRHRLARPLGVLMAEVVSVAVPDDGRPLVLTYVPDTARAARARYGDHMRRVARHTGRLLGARVVNMLRARPGADTAELSAQERAEMAVGRFTPRISGYPQDDRIVVLIDDIITTGQTAAAASAALEGVGIRVDVCASLAATRRRFYGDKASLST